MPFVEPSPPLNTFIELTPANGIVTPVTYVPGWFVEVNPVTGIVTFVPNGGDPYTKLLLHFNGANGLAAFPDVSGNAHDFYPANAALVSTTKAKFGTSALYVTSINQTGAGGLYGDGTGDHALGTGDFVLDFWHMPTIYAPGGQNYPLFDYGHDITLNTGGVWIGSNGCPFWITNPAGGTNGTIAIPINTWGHVAVVRSSGVTRIFINGVQSGVDMTDTINYVSTTNAPAIGASPGGQYCGPGFFDEVRVSKGTTRGWFSGFTPPVAPYTTDANTHLLMHFEATHGSLTFTDSSSQAHTFSTSASIAVVDTAQSKFGGTAAHVSANGSTYALIGDGSSDLALGTGDFVVDLWFRPSDFSDGFPMVLDWGFVRNAACPYMTCGGGVLSWYANDTPVITAGSTMTVNTWYHIALVRSSGVTRLFLNGVQTGGNYTDANNYPIAAQGPAIGSFLGHIHATAGWYDEVRISKGTDRGWFGGFTTPTSPY